MRASALSAIAVRGDRSLMDAVVGRLDDENETVRFNTAAAVVRLEIFELDYRTREVLDAVKAAGVEDNTIVLWLSDNAAAPTSGPFDSRASSNGPLRGELGRCA